MPVLSLDCHLPHSTPHIPSCYNKEQTTNQTKAINNSYIYIHISCKCDTNRAGHFTLDAYASRPVACSAHWLRRSVTWPEIVGWRCSGFYSSDPDTAMHTGICETELFSLGTLLAGKKHRRIKLESVLSRYDVYFGGFLINSPLIHSFFEITTGYIEYVHEVYLCFHLLG